MIQNITLGDVSVEIELPDICPNCGLGITAKFLTYHSATEIPYVGVIFECPACKKIGFAEYELVLRREYSYFTGTTIDSKDIFVNTVAVYPTRIIKSLLPESIKNFYPEFYEIYNQAHIAEQNNLHKIIGMAYRKALENLVKTYLIETFPDEQDDILSESLGKSIGRITYPKIQVLAKAASWIGNDETHMVKKNPDWEVKDMKGFILALCHLILAEKVADNAVDMITASSG